LFPHSNDKMDDFARWTTGMIFLVRIGQT
jgi:hypothetical protein